MSEPPACEDCGEHHEGYGECSLAAVGMSEPGGVPMFEGRYWTEAETATCRCDFTKLEREVWLSGVRIFHSTSCPWSEVGGWPPGSVEAQRVTQHRREG